MANTKTCVVIGAPGTVTVIKNQLPEIAVRAFAHNTPRNQLVEACVDDPDLKAVALCCKDFPVEHGAPLFRLLRQKLKRDVKLIALIQAEKGDNAIARELADLVDAAPQAFPMNPENAVTAIRKYWRNGVPPASHGADAEQTSPVVGGRRSEDEPFVVKDNARREAPTHSVHLEPSEGHALKDLLSSLQHNSPLSDEPAVVNIVGMHGQNAELDPRRIRPLPNQPRSKKSRGFSKARIAALGGSMQEGGQLEEVMVCPIVDNPDFDAQLIDGERRWRSALEEGLMLRAKVREDVKADDYKTLYLLSIMRNDEKEEHTTVEYVEMVRRLRGPEYNHTYAEIKRIFGREKGWVVRHEMLGRLDQEVLDLLEDDAPDEDGDEPAVEERRFTAQIALLLVGVPSGEQFAAAKHIVERKMNVNQARRYVLNLRRGLGLGSNAAGRHRLSKQAEAVRTLTQRNVDAYGVYLDKLPAEFEMLFASRTAGERSGLCQDLEKLAADILELAKRIRAVPV